MDLHPQLKVVAEVVAHLLWVLTLLEQVGRQAEQVHLAAFLGLQSHTQVAAVVAQRVQAAQVVVVQAVRRELQTLAAAVVVALVLLTVRQAAAGLSLSLTQAHNVA
jgi:hypothetical protein